MDLLAGLGEEAESMLLLPVYLQRGSFGFFSGGIFTVVSSSIDKVTLRPCETEIKLICDKFLYQCSV